MAKPRKTAQHAPTLDLVVPEDGIFTTYANHMMLGYTPFDIRIVFGEIVESSPETVQVEQRAQVTLSWIQAKALREYLTQLIQRHEAEGGEIKMPQGLAELSFDGKPGGS